MAYDMIARFAAGVSPTQLHVERVDGFNVLAVIDAYERKIPQALEDGPVMLDVVTYRFGGHSPSDVNAYRTEEEIQAWKDQDAIPHYAAKLIEAGVCTEKEIKQSKPRSSRETWPCSRLLPTRLSRPMRTWKRTRIS